MTIDKAAFACMAVLLAGCWSSWNPPVDTGADSRGKGDSVPVDDSESEAESDSHGDVDSSGDTSDSEPPDDTGETGETGDTGETGETGDTVDTAPSDADGDSYRPEDGDCDDADADVNPGAVEVCNGLDDDCDGGVDVDAADASTWYSDGDGDGFGDDASSERACVAPADSVTEGGDCDDSNGAAHPGATETWYDGVDEDCSGGSDHDQDGDGYDADSGGGEDCDDTDAARFPGARSWAVPGDAASIQEAVDAACARETIDVAAGTWLENVDFGGKALDLIGAGPDVTTLQGVGYAAVVTMGGGTLQGFTVRGGQARASGGGVLVQGAASAELIDLAIVENVASVDGGGVAVLDSTEVTLRDCEVYGNEAGGTGGGLSFSSEVTGGTTALVLETVSIEGNTSDSGAGAVRVDADTPVSFASVEVDDNYGVSGVVEGSGELAWVGGGASGNVGSSLLEHTGAASLGDLVFAKNNNGVHIDGDLVADQVQFRANGSESSPALWATGVGTLTDLSFIGDTGSSILVMDGGFDLTRVEVVDADVAVDAFAVQLSGSGAARHLLIAGVRDGSGLGLLAPDAADFQELEHVTVVASDEYGVQLSGVADLQFDLAYLLVADSGYAGVSGGGYRVGLTWADVSGSVWEEYQVDVSSSDDATLMELSPDFISYSPDLPPASWDLHLQPGSPLADVDAGAPDADGSAADIGAYGGDAADPDWYTDADVDGMPDGWERVHGLDPGTDDAASDLDADGLLNGEELTAGTDPERADTDGDHAADTEAEPLSASLHADAEYQVTGVGESLGSFCTLPDTDGDGVDELAVVIKNSGNTYQYQLEATATGVQSLYSYSTGPVWWWNSFGCTNIAGDFNADGEADVALSYVPYLILVAGPLADSVGLSSGTNHSSYVSAGYSGVAADFDGDGVDDLAVSAPSYSEEHSYGGAVFLYTDVAAALDASSSLGTDVATLSILGSAESEWFGSTTLVGDVNGDDAPDLVAANGNSTWVYHGPFTTAGTLSDADADVTTAEDPRRLYASMGQVTVPGDLDGDGADELVFQQGSGSSGLFVLSDPADGAVLGDAAQLIADSLRSPLTGAVKGGDLDGDGFGDLFVGTTTTTSNDTVLVFSGSATLAAERSVDDADRWLYDGGLGTTFASTFQVGDFDGDGRSDIAADTTSTGGYPGVELFFGGEF